MGDIIESLCFNRN